MTSQRPPAERLTGVRVMVHAPWRDQRGVVVHLWQALCVSWAQPSCLIYGRTGTASFTRDRRGMTVAFHADNGVVLYGEGRVGGHEASWEFIITRSHSNPAVNKESFENSSSHALIRIQRGIKQAWEYQCDRDVFFKKVYVIFSSNFCLIYILEANTVKYCIAKYSLKCEHIPRVLTLSSFNCQILHGRCNS